jgi:SAM-dependent methyltransferase
MNEWEAFFDYYAPRYMDEPFVTATIAEADFIEELLAPPPGARVLDLGCGTGRHSVELARRGYHVTGVDLSRGMLEQAAAAAAAAAVTVEYVKADATAYEPAAPFDLALCLCEGSFGLLTPSDDALEHELAILGTVRRALCPGGRFMLTVLNGLRMARLHGQEDVAAGRFDPMTMTELNSMEWRDGDETRAVTVRERGFTPTELALLCRVAGLRVDHVWGGTAGDWGRRSLDLDEYEIMVVGGSPEATAAEAPHPA